MTPAAVVIPTRGRPAYLDVALASVAPQARAARADVVVVDDGPDAGTRAVAERHGARYLPHPEPRGLNAARNTAIAAIHAPLLVFVDDDVEAVPGWLDALLSAAATHPGHEVLGGPIEARIDGWDGRACGREGPPITVLDLGSEDRDADHVWGANMAIRRAAFDRVGGFDPALEIYGDEEEWQRRLRSAGGRIRYVAAARVLHRRTGDDARLAALARAAWRRGRHGRRYDVVKGTAPALRAEARTLAGCAWHTVRRRCVNGPVMAAHSAGRMWEALRHGSGSTAARPMERS